MAASSKSTDEFKKNKPMDCVGSNEIINIGIGQCGVYMLHEYYSLLMDEHKIARDGRFIGNWNDTNDKLIMLNHNTFFTENQSNQHYVPRSIFFDFDSSSIDSVYQSYLSRLIPEENFYAKQASFEPTIVWPKGHYTDGAEIIDEAIDIVRRQVEVCDLPQGFCYYHSLGGGWGSGFGTLLMMKMRDNYPDRYMCTYSVYPSALYQSPSDHTAHHHNFEIYNTILSMPQLLENTDLCYTFDNGKLLHLVKEQCKVEHASYADVNWILAQMMSGSSATLRFHCEPTVNVTLKSFGVCFIPFPRLHFVAVSHAPLFDKTHFKYDRNVQNIIDNLTQKNEAAGIDLKADDKMFNVTFTYRGNNEDAIAEMDEFVMSYQENHTKDFVQWKSEKSVNVQSAFVYDGDNHYYKKYAPVVSTALISTCGIKQVFERFSKIFAKLFQRKTYLHWYAAEGMDAMEFEEADRNLRDLIVEYEKCNAGMIHFEDEADDSAKAAKDDQGVQT